MVLTHYAQEGGKVLKISPNDNNTYRTFTLANGLRVLITHAPDAHKSAASLVVNTGSFDDPTDRPGFAHFIEHLLFNGNQKYPKPAELNDFVAKHSGHCNAWTSTEHSSYHFDVLPSEFHRALDYFANMFIEPLFNNEAIEKEQNAIHAEYKLKLKDDSRRIQQVHKETCNPEHPFHKFTVGNKHTLSDLPGRQVKQELIDFWHNYYQAQFMTLAIVSADDIALLESKVIELFSNIHSHYTPSKKPKVKVPLYRGQDLAQFIAIKPVKELHKLNITFPFPGTDPWYQDKMLSFVAHIIGYEGAGSLFECLKYKGLVNALSAGNGISGSNFKDFNVSIELTEKGENNLEDILMEVFAYLNQLRVMTPPSYLYDEQRKLGDVSFKYQENIKPLKFANNLALNLHHYPVSDVLYGDYRMDGLNLERWHQIFEYFTAENLRVTLVSQGVHCDKKAHWYHTPYSVEIIPAEYIAELNNSQNTVHEYQFPKPNPYLTKEPKVEEANFTSPIPVQIVHELGSQAWFKQDVSFRVPKGNMYLGLDLPFGIKNKTNQTMMRFFCDLFMDAVSEQHYQAEMAGLSYNLYAHNSGMTLYTTGLSNNQDELLLTLLDSMLNIEFNQIRFEEVKKQLIKHWSNAENNKPISQLFALLNSNLTPNLASSMELANELNQISFEMFNTFQQSLFSQIYSDLLIYGNWDHQQAIEINNKITEKLAHIERVAELPRVIENYSEQKLKTIYKNIDHCDSAAVIYIQGSNKDSACGDTLIEKAMFILISQILSPFSFNYLRTEQQLGYLAGSGYMPLYNTPGFAIYIQSHDYDSDQLSNELASCLSLFAEEISTMSEQELLLHKQAVIHQYNETASNLNQKSQQLWIAIGNKDHTFDQKQKIAEVIATFNTKQISSWCQNHLVKSNLSGLALGSFCSE